MVKTLENKAEVVLEEEVKWWEDDSYLDEFEEAEAAGFYEDSKKVLKKDSRKEER